MSQIEEYERPYQIVYGTDGDEPSLVPGPTGATEWPIWRAKRMVIALLTSQIEKTANGDEREALAKIRQAFHEATTGEVIWGMVMFWKNRKGNRRFIGMIEKGRDYREAGKSPNKPGFTPSAHPTRSLDSNAHLRFGVSHSTGRPVTTRRPSDAERIAARMAGAARGAVEGERIIAPDEK